MLFNSYIFIVVFLPLTLAGFFLAGRFSHSAATTWLLVMSIVFYGWTGFALVPLLIGSALFNFSVGAFIQTKKAKAQPVAKVAMIFGVGANLVLLGYFKYADFLIDSVNAIFHGNVRALHIVLPLGISFFTFTQIAYLVDCYKKDIREYNLIHYLLFVSYFPHLIAGPIVHHAELMPQFARKAIDRIDATKITLGLTVFLIGLFKKTVLADGVSVYVAPVFDPALTGPVSFSAGWLGALAYSLQIYFDFSGYTDMAIGISAMFGILLPVNFRSPYKAANIMDFWRRWHITLSRFLRDYLYIPLGGNRAGKARRYANLMITMVLGGLWHGASWTFVAWGGLHGLYLVINHGWRYWRHWDGGSERKGLITRVGCVVLTYTAVVFAWVLFRADSLSAAGEIMRGMLGYHRWLKLIVNMHFLEHLGSLGNALHDWILASSSLDVRDAWPLVPWLWIAILTTIVWALPNTMELLRNHDVALPGPFHERAQKYFVAWSFTWPWLAFDIVLASVCILNISNVSPFLYYRF